MFQGRRYQYQDNKELAPQNIKTREYLASNIVILSITFMKNGMLHPNNYKMRPHG